MGGSCCACGRRRRCHSFPFIDVSLTPYVTIAKRESDGDWQHQSVRSSFFSSFWKKRGKQKFGPLLYIELRWNRICFRGFRWPPETSFLSLSLSSFSQTDPISHLIHSAHVPRRRHIWRIDRKRFLTDCDIPVYFCPLFKLFDTHWEKRFWVRDNGPILYYKSCTKHCLLLVLCGGVSQTKISIPGDWEDLAVGWASVK